MREEKLVDVQYVASKLDVNPRTVLRMVERGELPAIKVAHRLRFRLTDLDTYLGTRLANPVLSPKPGSDTLSSLLQSASSQGEWADPEEDAPLPLADRHPRERSALRDRDTNQMTGAHRLQHSKEALQLEIEQQRLELAREKLALQAQFLALRRTQIDHALETANKAVNLLPPEADPQIKSMLVQSLLPRLLPPDSMLEMDALQAPTSNKGETLL